MGYDDLYFSCIDLHCQPAMFTLSSVFFFFFIMLNQLVLVGIFTFFLYCLAVRFVYLSIVLSVSPCFPDEGGETSPKRRIEQESAGCK